MRTQEKTTSPLHACLPKLSAGFGVTPTFGLSALLTTAEPQNLSLNLAYYPYVWSADLEILNEFHQADSSCIFLAARVHLRDCASSARQLLTRGVQEKIARRRPCQ